MTDIYEVDGVIEGSLSGESTVSGSISNAAANIGGAVTVPVSFSSYNSLRDKPQINGVELVGDKSFEELGDSPLTNMEIKELFNNIFE